MSFSNCCLSSVRPVTVCQLNQKLKSSTGYAILYAYGGIYSDIDTTCRRPLEHWFELPPPLYLSKEQLERLHKFKSKASKSNEEEEEDKEKDTVTKDQLFPPWASWQQCSMIISLENDMHLCQWVRAAVLRFCFLQRHTPVQAHHIAFTKPVLL